MNVFIWNLHSEEKWRKKWRKFSANTWLIKNLDAKATVWWNYLVGTKTIDTERKRKNINGWSSNCQVKPNGKYLVMVTEEGEKQVFIKIITIITIIIPIIITIIIVSLSSSPSLLPSSNWSQGSQHVLSAPPLKSTKKLVREVKRILAGERVWWKFW